MPIRSLHQAIQEHLELLGQHYAGRRADGLALVTGVGTEVGSGLPNSVSVRFGSGAEETFPVSLGQQIHVGEQWIVSGEVDPVTPQYKLERRFYGEAVSQGVVLARDLPRLVIRDDYGRSGGPSEGGYSAVQIIRYYAIRRAQYDLYSIAVPQYMLRYKEAGSGMGWMPTTPTGFPSPRELTQTHLTEQLDAGASTATVYHVENFPTCLDGEVIRVLIGNEQMEGQYHTGSPNGSITGLVRGIEPIADEPSSGNVLHENGTTVTLLTVDAALNGLLPGMSYDYQIAAVDYTQLPGPWTDTRTFTAWTQTLPPPKVGTVTVEAVTGGFEIRWPKVPIADLAGYRVRRNWWPDVADFADDPPIARDSAFASGVKLINGVNEEELSTSNWAIWPSTRGIPDADLTAVPSRAPLWGYFGVKAVRLSGVERNGEDPTGDSTWGADVEPPPAPNPANVTVTAMESGVLITVSPIDPAWRQRGWRFYVFWSATDTEGTNETERGRTEGNTFFIPLQPGGAHKYFQVVSVDHQENMTPRVDDAVHWKSDTYAPPAPTNVRIQPGAPGYLVQWDPIPTVDASSPVRVRGYRLWRHVANGGAGTPPTYTPAGTVLPTEIGSTEATYPYSVGSGNWIGVQGIAYNGNPGPVAWAIDPVNAPVPTLAGYTTEPVPGGYAVKVNPALEITGRTHPSFREYLVVHVNADGTHQIVGSFSGLETTILDPAITPATLFYVQLLSVLTSGRVSPAVMPRETNSRPTRFGHPGGSPPNGNFNSVFPTGAPHYWAVIPIDYGYPPGTYEWAATGGLNGSRRFVWTPPLSGVVPPVPIGYSLISTVASILNPGYQLTAQCWWKQSAIAVVEVRFRTIFRFFSDDYGAVPLSNVALTYDEDVASATVDYWRKTPEETLNVAAIPAGARSVALTLEFELVDLSAAASIPWSLSIDDAIVWSSFEG